jgi:hypothetical protein
MPLDGRSPSECLAELDRDLGWLLSAFCLPVSNPVSGISLVYFMKWSSKLDLRLNQMPSARQRVVYSDERLSAQLLK